MLSAAATRRALHAQLRHGTRPLPLDSAAAGRLSARLGGTSLVTHGQHPLTASKSLVGVFQRSETTRLFSSAPSRASPSSTPPSSRTSSEPLSSDTTSPPTEDWEENPNFNIETFSQLPHTNFGVNQHMIINDELKEALRQILWQFRAPIRYAFAYGSGVFPQSGGSGSGGHHHVPTDAEIRAVHPKAPLSVQRAQDGSPKMIDFIFGVTYTQHWHSLNLAQHRDHYSALGALGSGAVSHVQDRWGAGVYYNPYVVVNGILIKYGVVNLDTLCTDLSEWQTLYLAGRLHKPVKILRDDARVRLANQINLLSALRTALLLLPERFGERDLYSTIAAISYLGDPRMRLPTEDPRKVANIVDHNMANFRRLYAPLIDTLPNVTFNDPRTHGGGSDPFAAAGGPAPRRRNRDGQTWLDDADADLRLVQDMDPVRRANMVRRLPKAFRERLYFQYQKKFAIPRGEFERMMQASRDEGPGSGGDAAPAGGSSSSSSSSSSNTGFRRQQAGGFERRIVQGDPDELRAYVRQVIRQTIHWPSTTQSLKGVLTAGVRRSVRYMGEKMAKWRAGKQRPADENGAAPPPPPPSPPPEPAAPTGGEHGTVSDKKA